MQTASYRQEAVGVILFCIVGFWVLLTGDPRHDVGAMGPVALLGFLMAIVVAGKELFFPSTTKSTESNQPFPLSE